MSKLFFNWMRYLENKQVGNFLNLYSHNCMLFQGNGKKTYYNHSGVFDFYEPLLFSNDDILMSTQTCCKSPKHPNVILANTRFEFCSKIYDLHHSIFLIHEKDEFKILCHYTKNTPSL